MALVDLAEGAALGGGGGGGGGEDGEGAGFTVLAEQPQAPVGTGGPPPAATALAFDHETNFLAAAFNNETVLVRSRHRRLNTGARIG